MIFKLFLNLFFSGKTDWNLPEEGSHFPGGQLLGRPDPPVDLTSLDFGPLDFLDFVHFLDFLDFLSQP